MITLNKKYLLKDTVVSIVLVSQNDHRMIVSLTKQICQFLSKTGLLFELLIIDNNSDDDTVDQIRNLNKKFKNVRLIVLSKKYHLDIALTAALDSTIGDYVILFDKNFDPVEIISLIVDKLYQGHDVVTGKLADVDESSSITKLFLRLVEKMSDQDFSHRPNFSMGLSRKAVNSFTRVRRKSRNFSYINFLIGLKKETVIYKSQKKFLNQTKSSNFLNIFLETVDVIISNSFKPIRFITIMGMLLSGLFLLYILMIIILVTFFGMKWIAPQGWISLATVLGTLFFLLFSVLTIVSEYLIRIMSESRDEPLYFISDEFDHTQAGLRRKKLNII